MTITNQRHLQHLYWRAGFGLMPSELATKTTIAQAIDDLFDKASTQTPLQSNFKALKFSDLKQLTKQERKVLIKQSAKKNTELNAQWIRQMATPNANVLLEKMTLFWHGHFACITKNAQLSLNQNNTIRKHALGNFRDLVLAIAKDGGMIRFLNNQQNRKQKPNENFMRELLELFTIGRGHYTEQDIKEGARAFTGWSSNLAGEYLFRTRWHDYGSKTFMGKTGQFDGDDIIDIILEKKQTAQFIVSKIYRYFVNEQLDKQHLRQLTNIFYNSDYNIAILMRAIFESNWFYADKNIGVKIKSPIELIVGMVRILNVRFQKPQALIFLQRALGQMLFKPPNVAGWAGGKAWIDNATLMLRLNLAGWLFQMVNMDFRVKEEFEARQRNKARKFLNATVDAQPLVNAFENYEQSEIFEQMTTYLLQPTTTIQKSLIHPYTINSSKADYIRTLAMRLMSLPEYQMC